MLEFVVDREDQVSAVIERQVRVEVERALDAPVEFFDVHGPATGTSRPDLLE